MSRLLDALSRSVESGRLEPWKAALFGAWIQTERGLAGEDPLADDLAGLLLDPRVINTLRREATNGPWDVLVAQARSYRAHGSVGDALAALIEGPLASEESPGVP